MADYLTVETTRYGVDIAADDVNGIRIPRVKLVLGNNNTNDGDVSSTNPVPTITDLSKQVFTLLNAVTANGTSSAVAIPKGSRTIQASIAGTGAVSGTVTWYGSNRNANSGGVLLATSTLSGTNEDTTGNTDTIQEYPYMYCVLAGISGTGAAVTADIGV